MVPPGPAAHLLYCSGSHPRCALGTRPSERGKAMAATSVASAVATVSGPATREFNFGSGMPDPRTFPSEALAAAAQRAIVREGTSLVRYPDQRGYAPLREIAAA